jgi:hypothetical protein
MRNRSPYFMTDPDFTYSMDFNLFPQRVHRSCSCAWHAFHSCVVTVADVGMEFNRPASEMLIRTLPDCTIYSNSNPSHFHPAMPPSIFFTFRLRRARRTAALSAPLQWGPLQ